MIHHITGSKDSYITNKIINGSRRATGGNVGYASTVDLFKLYGENTLKGFKGTCDGVDAVEQSACSGTWSFNLVELSRGLIEFDLDQLKTELDSIVDTDTASLSVKLIYKDVQGTQVAPSNFTLQLWALTAPWQEGIGDDVSAFSNIQAANWLSSSLGTLWPNGAGGRGDLLASWDQNDGTSKTYVATQTFADGTEDLEMDITEYVRAYWDTTNATVQNNYGWMLKFTTNVEDTESKSYFVKRFASRHTRNSLLRPKIEVTWSDYHLDDRLNFQTSTTNNLSIKNNVKGSNTAFYAAPQVTLSYGTWSLTPVTSTVVQLGGVNKTGMYEATIPAFDLFGTESDLKSHLEVSGSIQLQERWEYTNAESNAVLVYSGTLDANYSYSSNSSISKDYRFNLVGLEREYSSLEMPEIRIFARDKKITSEPVRIPIELKSHIINKAYYRIRDANSGDVLVRFSDKLATPNESTRISTDGEGMYFAFPASVLPRGKTYTIDIAYYDQGKRKVHEFNTAFKVV